MQTEKQRLRDREVGKERQTETDRPTDRQSRLKRLIGGGSFGMGAK